MKFDVNSKAHGSIETKEMKKSQILLQIKPKGSLPS